VSSSLLLAFSNVKILELLCASLRGRLLRVFPFRLSPLTVDPAARSCMLSFQIGCGGRAFLALIVFSGLVFSSPPQPLTVFLFPGSDTSGFGWWVGQIFFFYVGSFFFFTPPQRVQFPLSEIQWMINPFRLSLPSLPRGILDD